jgi:hypothetical protein
MGDPGIVPDVESSMAHDAGQEAKAEVVEREEVRELEALVQTPQDIVICRALNQPEAEPGLFEEPADEGSPACWRPDLLPAATSRMDESESLLRLEEVFCKSRRLDSIARTRSDDGRGRRKGGDSERGQLSALVFSYRETGAGVGERIDSVGGCIEDVGKVFDQDPA